MKETMIGTTGSTFEVVSKTPAGRIGVRNIGGSNFRIRVEPAAGVTLNLAGWKQPSYSQNRYSTVVDGAIAVAEAVAKAQTTLVQASKAAVEKAAAALKAAEEAFNNAKAAYQSAVAFA